MFEDITAWQKMYLVGMIVGVAVFIHLIGWLTDKVKLEYRSTIDAWKLAIKQDLECSRKLVRRYHEEKRKAKINR
jgi:hypothetical protein